MIELLVRLAISMAVVMAVMGLAARFVRRRQEAGLGGGGFRGSRAGRGLGTGRLGAGSLGAGRAGSGGRSGRDSAGAGSAGADGGGTAGFGAGGPAVGPNTLGAKLGSVFGAPRPRRARPIPPVEVVYRRALAKGAAVAVVEATGKQFLLGVTEQSITLLAELPGPGNAAALDAHAAPPTNVATPTSGPVPTSGAQAGTRAGDAQVSDLEIWDEFDDWQQADRMPASPPDAVSSERQNAWKLTLDSLRERTIRR
ncbi:MAG TPA: flagellar biosynthetic protein FliO [Acidimicrobiales bacterium]|nr:flagellar biosynthetic protein FliO [Acidimicrobiales bacterium]